MSRRFWLPLFAVLAVLFALPRAAHADSPDTYLKDKQSELTKLLKAGKSADNEKKITTLFDQLLDYEAVAKDSLGKYWDERSAAEKKDFQELLQKLVRNAYKKNLKKTLKYDVQYKGVTAAKKGKLVQTVAKNKDNAREEPVSIDYVMNKDGAKWRVQDIVTEGSSMVTNYKSQFTKVIKKNGGDKKGFDELMKKLKKKLEKEGG
jgi:phospholipid transport system substrate-binding protein